MIFLNGPVVEVDKVRLTLEASSAFWFSCVKLAGYVVAAGCVLEAPETFVTMRRWWLLKFVSEEREETDTDKKSWIVPLAALGLVLVVGGIVAETFAEGKVSDFDAQLRAHESDKITVAEGLAASAIRDSGTAKDSARVAAEAANLASFASSAAKERADKANKSAGNALSLAGSVRSEVVTAEANTAKVKEKIADRELSQIKRGILVELLRKARRKSTEPVEVYVGADSPDAPNYAREIISAINDPETGWHAKDAELMTSDGRAKGVLILIHDLSLIPPWAGDLQVALQSAGIGGSVGLNTNTPVGTLRILVERKD